MAEKGSWATHCKRGHARIPENMYGRACKICAKERVESRRVKPRKKDRLACSKGHPYIAGNFKIETNARGAKFRLCLICKLAAVHAYWLLTKYGITEDEKNLIFLKQGECCAACKGKFKNKRDMCVDHSHQTGKVRGILCQDCNLALGHVQDKIEKLDDLIQYLKRTEYGGINTTDY